MGGRGKAGNGQAQSCRSVTTTARRLAAVRIDPLTAYAELLKIRDQAHRIYIEACQRLNRHQQEPPGIQRTRQYIENHFTESLTLAAVAKQAGLCPQQFRKRFKQSTGKTFCQYLAHRRLEFAKELLLKRDRKMIYVALDAGFSVPTFYRWFHKLTGQSPKQYRRNDTTLVESPPANYTSARNRRKKRTRKH